MQKTPLAAALLSLSLTSSVAFVAFAAPPGIAAPLESSARNTGESDQASQDAIPNIVVVGVREDLPGKDSVLPGDRRLAPAADGADLLRQVNGLSLGRFGGRGLEPRLRGQGEGRINVLLDGAYIHGGCPNRMDPPTSFASVNTFERIVVLKGVQSLRYGGGGSGGTLLFERENEPQERGFSGQFRAGSSDNGVSRDLALETSWSGDRLYFRVNAEDRQADNYRDGAGESVRSAFNEDSLYLAAGLRLRDSDRLELVRETTATRDALYPGAGMDAPMDESLQWRLRYRAVDLGLFDSLEVDLYRSDVEHLMDNYSNRPLNAPMAMRVPSTSDTRGARVVGEFSSSFRARWTVGVDYQDNRREAVRYMGMPGSDVSVVNAYMWPDARLEQMGLFAELRYAVSDQRRVTAGLRFDRVEAATGDINTSPTSTMLEGPAELYARYYGITGDAAATENNGAGLLRFEQDLGENWTAFAGASVTRRTADASERYLAAANAMPSMRWIGNPRLAPETHQQVDMGVLWRRDAHQVDAVVYVDQVDDYILRDRAHGQAGILTRDNASIYRNVDARLFGMEIDWDWQISEHWNAGAAAAWVRATNTDDNRPIAQTPPLNGSLRLAYTASRWDAGASLRWSARQDRVEDNSMLDSGLDAGPTPSWAVLNLYSRVDLGSFGELHAGLDNLLDRRYAEHLNRGNRDPFYPEPLRVNEPGRTAWLRYEYRF